MSADAVTKVKGLMEKKITDSVERVTLEETYDDQVWLHTYRYRFALPWVQNCRVLDIACGQGYGSRALLDGGAADVVGVDVCEEAVAIAREKYHVNAILGSATAIPLPDRSVDVVVSMETIEHILEHEEFASEINRVLVPGGILVMSTPNHQYWLDMNHHNPFHVKELFEEEFDGLLRRYFDDVSMYSQGCVSAAPCSLRAFSSANSRWRKVAAWFLKFDHAVRWLPRYWKVRQELSTYARSGWDFSIPIEYRDDPVAMVMREGTSWSEKMHHFRVRPRSKRSGEKFQYIVAIAKKRRT